MKQLIKNELIKLKAQKTYVVLSCIVLALVIVVSFFTSVLMTPLNMLIAHRKNFLTESAAYDWAIEKIKEDPDSALAGVLRTVFKDPKSKSDEMREQAEEEWEKGYKSSYVESMAYAAFFDFAEQNAIEDWVVENVRSSLLGLYRWREVYEGIGSGKYTVEDIYKDATLFYLLINFPYAEEVEEEPWFGTEWFYDPETNQETIKFYRLDEMGLQQECTLADVVEAVSVYKPICDRMIEEIEQYALTIEPDGYYDALIMQEQGELSSAREALATIEEALANPDSNDTNPEYTRAYKEMELAHCQGTIEDIERVIAAYESLKEKNASPSGNAFALVSKVLPEVLEMRRYNMQRVMESEINGDFILLTKAQQSNFKHQIRVYDKAIVAIEYAYTHDVLPEDMHQSSVKATFINNLSTASFLISAISIVLASMILSREFATGTVRLWVIRPKTRSKLLGSKIATLLLYVCTMMGASFIITYIFALLNHVIDLFFYGQSTMFVNNYGVLFGKAFAIPAIAEHLWALVVLTLPVILYTMLCLFVSVLTKKGVLSIVCGMIVLMFAKDIQAFALIVANYTSVFGYALQVTVLPYLGMDRLLVTALDFGASAGLMGVLDGLGALTGLEDMLMSSIWGAMPYVCSSFVGVGVLIVHILLIIWASLFAFKRTQIKS
ncbi:MAG: ABC transporter permease [Clostridia bacterium]|nr:ABC transporter permease [Clostridia bacterium]